MESLIKIKSYNNNFLNIIACVFFLPAGNLQERKRSNSSLFGKLSTSVFLLRVSLSLAGVH